VPLCTEIGESVILGMVMDWTSSMIDEVFPYSWGTPQVLYSCRKYDVMRKASRYLFSNLIADDYLGLMDFREHIFNTLRSITNVNGYGNAIEVNVAFNLFHDLTEMQIGTCMLNLLDNLQDINPDIPGNPELNLVLMSDGEQDCPYPACPDDISEDYWIELQTKSMSIEPNTRIHTIFIDDSFDMDALYQIAYYTNGNVYGVAADCENLGSAMKRLMDDIRYTDRVETFESIKLDPPEYSPFSGDFIIDNTCSEFSVDAFNLRGPVNGFDMHLVSPDNTEYNLHPGDNEDLPGVLYYISPDNSYLYNYDSHFVTNHIARFLNPLP
jgi:hypothetical protein